MSTLGQGGKPRTRTAGGGLGRADKDPSSCGGCGDGWLAPQESGDIPTVRTSVRTSVTV